MKVISWLVLSFLTSSAFCAAGLAGEKAASSEILVAAAADLSAVLPKIAAGFEKQSKVKVKFSFAGSGALTQQIQNGAPFDVFFSADMEYPQQLIQHGNAEGGIYQYAVGKLVLWAPAGSPLDVEHKGMRVLADPSVKKISLANPQHAPYGRAAVAALKHVDLCEQVVGRLVMGENVAQAAQFVESGNAQVGFVALAHAMSPAMRGKGKYWLIPVEAYPPLEQGVVLISRSRHKQEAAAFIEFMKTKPAVDLLQRYGFTLPKQK